MPARKGPTPEDRIEATRIALSGIAAGDVDLAFRLESLHPKTTPFPVRCCSSSEADPDLLGEVMWWRTDDFFVWARDALVLYVRAAAERRGDPVPVVCARVAARHGVELTTPS